MKKIGLALGEGGARGIAHIAYLKALDELGVKVSVIAGTSMGALIGALYASGISGIEIEKILNGLNFLQYGKFLDLQLRKGGMIKGENIKKFLSEILPVKNFEELKTNLRIVATDYWKQEKHVFKEGNLSDAIRASISIPGLFKAVNLKGRLFIDGGCTDPLPFDIIRDECDILIAIDVAGKKEETNLKSEPRIYEALFQTYYIMMSAIVENMKKLHKIDILETPNTSKIKILDFHKYKKIIKIGEENVEGFKRKVERAINL